jgi:ATP/ADP translocase
MGDIVGMIAVIVGLLTIIVSLVLLKDNITFGGWSAGSLLSPIVFKKSSAKLDEGDND